MSIKVKVVNLTGEIVLAELPDHRAQLLNAFAARESTVLVSLTQATDIDLFGVQLLYAARRQAERVGREFHLTGAVPEAIARRLYESGFVASIVRDGQDLDRLLHEFQTDSATTGDASNA
jgi:anti-anti-sigma regulatory factor